MPHAHAIRRRCAVAVVTVVALAWAVLLALHGRGPQGGLGALPLWTLMTLAMMIAPALPAVQHVAENTLRRRRRRAIACFLAAYIATWVASGALALAALALVSPDLPRDLLLAAGLAAAAAWQLLPYQRRFIRACHRTVPLPPVGWRAAAGCARFGVRQARACIGVCLPLILVMAAILHAGIAWMVALTAIVIVKRRRPDAERLAIPLAAVLAVMAVGALLLPAGPASAGGDARRDDLRRILVCPTR
jgi:predicted metal-binding membrane protein